MQQQKIFNKTQYRLHRDRSALKKTHALCKYVENDILERISICKLPEIISVLEFGGRGDQIVKSLKSRSDLIVSADLSQGVLRQKSSSQAFKIECDEELLPFANDSFDLVVSNLHMHWTNNILGALSHCHRVLNKGGVFLLSMIGGISLSGLRNSFVEVESKNNNVQYHVSPMIRLDSLNMLMQKSGFKDVVVDSYNLKFECDDFYSMLNSLRSMGESNCLQGKVCYLKKAVLEEVAQVYSKKYATERGGGFF